MKRLLFVLLVVLSPLCGLFSQTYQKILFSGEAYAWQSQFAKDQGVPNVPILYQWQFVNSDGLTFNKKLMEKYMDELIPDKNASGYAILDWEGYIYNVLAGWESVSSATYKIYLNTFISALLYAKSLRPNTQFSYYNLPTKAYFSYKGGSDFMKKNLPLLKVIDFLAPSFYILYYGKTVAEEFAYQYITDNLLYSLELGVKVNKDVHAFVWHRYHPLSSSNGNKLIDYTTFNDIIGRIINTSYKGKKVDGIIWWNCEDFLYQSRSSDPIMMEEYKTVTNVSTYKYNLLKGYLDNIKSVVNK